MTLNSLVNTGLNGSVCLKLGLSYHEVFYIPLKLNDSNRRLNRASNGGRATNSP